MSLAQAFFVMLAFAGACSFAYLIGSFLQFHDHHRNIRRRRWPREQHRSYFTDCRRVPEDDAP